MEGNIIFCGNCGEKLDTDLNFCPHCGAKIVKTGVKDESDSAQNGKNTDIPQASASTNKNGKFSSAILIVLIIACIVSAVGFIAGRKQAKSEKTDVEIQISEENTIVVPEITGTDVETAKNILTSLGVIPKVSECYSTKYTLGLVDSSMPRPGESVAKGSAVEVFVSKGYKRMIDNTATASMHCDAGLFAIKDYFELGKVEINEGVFTADISISGMTYSSLYNLVFCDMISTGVYAEINGNSERVTASLSVAEPLEDELIFRSTVKTYSQNVTFTADISSLPGADNPSSITIYFPLMDIYLATFSGGWQSDWYEYAESAYITFTVENWTPIDQ